MDTKLLVESFKSGDNDPDVVRGCLIGLEKDELMDVATQLGLPMEARNSKNFMREQITNAIYGPHSSQAEAYQTHSVRTGA